MLMSADMVGGVPKDPKYADVIYVWSLKIVPMFSNALVRPLDRLLK